MEKYGVEMDSKKIASEGCPICGRKVEVHGSVKKCLLHGTEGFEGDLQRSDESQRGLRGEQPGRGD